MVRSHRPRLLDFFDRADHIRRRFEHIYLGDRGPDDDKVRRSDHRRGDCRPDDIVVYDYYNDHHADHNPGDDGPCADDHPWRRSSRRGLTRRG